ncbi:MAG: TlpA family protein disulfide reductase [Dehalococcoidia bacterium]|nr:TlpA family protein disulfide reductase [Dehalococcoidia bacterium]
MKKKLLIGSASLAGLFLIVYIIMVIMSSPLPPCDLKSTNVTVSPAEVAPNETVKVTTHGVTYNMTLSSDEPPVFCPYSSTTHDLTISATGQGATNPSVGTYEYDNGTQVAITASPAFGWKFDNWTGDVSTITDVNSASATITVNGNYSITANFQEVDVAPDFTLLAMTGANVTLSELEGTPIVLNFWSISCYWCRKQLPYLENVARQSVGEIEVVAINIVDNAASLEDFFAEYEPTMSVALDSNGETFTDYCLKYNNPRGAIPFTLFIDSEGTMRYKQTGAFPSETALWDTLHEVFEP